MEMLPQHPDAPAHSLQIVAAPVPNLALERSRERGLPNLRLAESRVLTLAQPSPDDAPEGWQAGISRLACWLDLDLAQIPQPPASGLRRVTVWAMSAVSSLDAAAPAPPIFAPWQCWSPIAFQQHGNITLPRASWVSSYLFDYGTGKSLSRGVVDIQLMSPLPAACMRDDDVDAPMPAPGIMQAMIEAARTESRQKIVIVTDVRRRNAMIRQLLVLDRSVTRDGPQIEVQSIESTLCELVQGRSRWDAIIVLPELRSLVLAMLGQVYGIKNPLPMLWHHRGVTLICAETLDDTARDLPFDAPLLVQALALALREAELNTVARRLMQGVGRLWDCGIVTSGRGSVAPYVTEISDREFIEELCRGVAVGQRAVAHWRALPACPEPTHAPTPAQLRLVRES
jgi:hypothetical protein